MSDMSYTELKSYILSSIDISSNDLTAISASFSKLYKAFQTEAVNKVHVENIPNTCFKWIYSNNSNRDKVMLFFHGGGYTMGSTEDHLELITQLILKTGITILSVDYHLVPSSHFPAPLEDAFSAFQWLLQKKFNPQQIGFSGISAGGLLTTQLIFKCQEENIPLPKFALVLSGPCNLNFDTASTDYNAERDWINKERLQHIKNHYLPQNLNPYKNLLNPTEACYKNYPATFFQAGDYELLLEDSLCFYRKLREQHHNVYLNIVPELPHCWQLFSKVYEPGRKAINAAADFLNQHV